jgi:hypothetical protein
MKEYIVRFFLTALVLSWLGTLAWAQQAQNPQPQSLPVAISDKTGNEAVCEGAAEIIPSGQQTFVRKRYVAAQPKAKAKLTKPRPRK